jgi:hypothetical protein
MDHVLGERFEYYWHRPDRVFDDMHGLLSEELYEDALLLACTSVKTNMHN